MEWWREALIQLFLRAALTVAAGFAIMTLHGALLYPVSRCRGAQALTDYVSKTGLFGLAASAATSVLLASQLQEVPWSWLWDALLLTVVGTVLVAWLGPPREHVEDSRLCQIGRGSAYSHYYGYLSLMKHEHGVRKRLRKWRSGKEAELGRADRPPPGPAAAVPPDWVTRFHDRAVFVLAPDGGDYPSPLSELNEEDMNEQLPGVSPVIDSVPEFTKHVGGNERRYGKFTIHRVTSSDESDSNEVYVALDTIDALQTLSRLGQVKMVGIHKDDLRRQQQDMMAELRKIIEKKSHLRGQIHLVLYRPGEHVGDRILQLLKSPSSCADVSGDWSEVGSSMAAVASMLPGQGN